MRFSQITSLLLGTLSLALALPAETSPESRDARKSHWRRGHEHTRSHLPPMHKPCAKRRNVAREPDFPPPVTVTTTTTITAIVETASANPQESSPISVLTASTLLNLVSDTPHDGKTSQDTKMISAVTRMTAEHIEEAAPIRTSAVTGSQKEAGEEPEESLLADMTITDGLGLLGLLADALIHGVASQATSLIENGTADAIGNDSAPAAQMEKAVVGLIDLGADAADDLVLGVLDQIIGAIKGEEDE
ncbi:hypothetical protein M406DRAFT_73251 [Cryphonectria parasitica EP155]|uniref:Uncharacterized protein n=1 Tax=Cryphonectria parasitica (strain ATCC 38755 / EP155) TaxID=660469 RepID=A0A9P5CKB9_CRYP1|nr:uncharacterized protein M406DRAFT_73251 [Cryphonectria parasitica EP155]KAF3760791.1 hypothetical protein M406DRAFT_73251 [Cryphonectria parasitica EP155]